MYNFSVYIKFYASSWLSMHSIHAHLRTVLMSIKGSFVPFSQVTESLTHSRSLLTTVILTDPSISISSQWLFPKRITKHGIRALLLNQIQLHPHVASWWMKAKLIPVNLHHLLFHFESHPSVSWPPMRWPLRNARSASSLLSLSMRTRTPARSLVLLIRLPPPRVHPVLIVSTETIVKSSASQILIRSPPLKGHPTVITGTTVIARSLASQLPVRSPSPKAPSALKNIMKSAASFLANPPTTRCLLLKIYTLPIYRKWIATNTNSLTSHSRKLSPHPIMKRIQTQNT